MKEGGQILAQQRVLASRVQSSVGALDCHVEQVSLPFTSFWKRLSGRFPKKEKCWQCEEIDHGEDCGCRTISAEGGDEDARHEWPKGGKIARAAEDEAGGRATCQRWLKKHGQISESKNKHPTVGVAYANVYRYFPELSYGMLTRTTKRRIR